MTQTINLGTTCPKAGFGEVPQQAFLRPSRAAKIASVATLALLAVSALPPTVVFWELVAYNVKIVFDIFRKENQKKL